MVDQKVFKKNKKRLDSIKKICYNNNVNKNNILKKERGINYGKDFC